MLRNVQGKYEAKVEVMNGSSAKVSREDPKKPRRSYAKKANNVETTPKPVIESVTPAAEIGKSLIIHVIQGILLIQDYLVDNAYVTSHWQCLHLGNVHIIQASWTLPGH